MKYYISLAVSALFTILGLIICLRIPEGAKAVEYTENLEIACVCWFVALIAYIYNMKKA